MRRRTPTSAGGQCSTTGRHTGCIASGVAPLTRIYQFVWDGASYAYAANNAIPVITLVGGPADADASSMAMLHSGNDYHLYLRRLGDPTTLYQYIWVPGTTTYQWGYGIYLPSLRVTGFPPDTDWSRWDMLHDGADYRLYVFHYGRNNQISQGAWNAAAGEYQYQYNSIPQVDLVDFPADSDVGRSAMLHDGANYRFYFQTL